MNEFNDIKKLPVIGNSGCGKTCLLNVIISGKFPEYPIIRYQYKKELIVDNQKVNLEFFDSHVRDENFDRLRFLCYYAADVVLLCFSIDDLKSLESVRTKWQPDIKHWIPYVQYLLVGTKLDLRSDESNEQHLITFDEGLKMSIDIGASGYMECSAKLGIGIQDILEKSGKLAVNSTKKHFYRKKCCFIL